MNIYAHRGASSYAPENTIPAFQKAIDMHADGIELDVRLTKDGIPVINHDATINRTSDGKGYIHEMTLNQLKKYNFGKLFNKTYKNEKIVTLEEFFTLMGDNKLPIHLELKNGPVIPKDLEEKVLHLSNVYGVEDRIVYSSFDHISLQRLTQLNPEAKIGLLFYANLTHLFDYIDQTDLDIYSIHPNHFYLTEKMLEQAHKRNILVNLYTVNTKELALTYQKMGANGIFTNDPILLNEDN